MIYVVTQRRKQHLAAHGAYRPTCLRDALCNAAGAEGVDDLGVLGEALRGVLGEDQVAVGHDVEYAVIPLYQLGVDAERAADGGRQTGGLGEVLSARAVFD